MLFEDFWGLGGLIMMISRKPSPRCWGAPRDLRWQQGQYIEYMLWYAMFAKCQMLQSSDYSDRMIYEFQGSSGTMSYKHDNMTSLGPCMSLMQCATGQSLPYSGNLKNMRFAWREWWPIVTFNSEVVHFRWFPRGSCYTMLYCYFSSFDVTGQGTATGSTGLSQPNETISSIQHTDTKYQTSLFAEGL